MATGPKIAADPVELLTPDLSREEPWLNKIWGPALVGSVTFVSVCFGNYATRRPPLSGIHRHIVLSGIGAWIGKYLDDSRKEYLAERDAVLRHYITLHREDFPDFERQKYSELLLPWTPIR